MGVEWTSCLYFFIDGEWKKLRPDEVIDYFRDVLQADNEVIKFSEIRKYNLSNWFLGLFGYWHEYTIVETTNWYWSFERNSIGIFVQRGKNEEDVRCYFGGQKRRPDEPEGRSSEVSYGENIVNIVEWIIRRNELNVISSYYCFDMRNHWFASLLYEAITRTNRENSDKIHRRLNNTE